MTNGRREQLLDFQARNPQVFAPLGLHAMVEANSLVHNHRLESYDQIHTENEP